MKITITLLLGIFLCGEIIYGQGIRQIDFEAGGFVLAQVPSKDGSKVYARTDVGGVYKKTGDGDWKFIGEFATTPAALMVQSIDLNPYDANEIIVACGMDYLPDDRGRGVWKSNDDGSTWTQVLGPETGNTEVNFGGNVFRLKLGGPCLRWHPSVKDRIFAGTMADPSTGSPYIFMSNDDGRAGTWNLINSGSGITGSVVCIQVHPSHPDEVWIGTDKGLWRTKDNGVTWSEQIFSSQINGVYQILLKQNSTGGLTGFVATGNLYRIENDCSSITDLAPKFGYYSGYGAEIIGLQFMNNTESTICVSRMGNDTKFTKDDGETWSARYEYVLDKQYNPKHTLFTQDKIYTSNIIGFQNPANLDIWYVSGGAGPFITTNHGASWRYNGSGINMTVVYDVAFSPNGDIYIPISDWGMARTNEATLPKIIDYSRKYTLDPPPPENNGDSYMPNVCRVLISQLNNERIYLIGGSVFSYYPVIAKSERRGEPNTYQIMSPQGLLCYPNFGPGYDAIISDGEITTDGVNDNIVLLMGGGQYKRKVFDANNSSAYWYGVYYSDNSGASFEKSVFEGYSDEIYRNSIVGGLFSPTDYLDVDPVDKARVYLYLEGGNDNGIKAGGLFVSTNYGKSFNFLNYVIDNPAIDYRNRGAIDIDPSGSGILWAGIENYGLFKSNDRGENFSKMPEFESVSTVDCRGNLVALFGRMNGDTYNKIYLSKDSGSTWEHIYLSGFGVIPSVRKLDLRENKDNELWISTGGQGLFIYNF